MAAAGVSVYVKGPAETDFLIGEPVETDAHGRFSITVFEGVRYRIFAEEPDGLATSSDAASLLFTASHDLRPLTLVVRPRETIDGINALSTG